MRHDIETTYADATLRSFLQSHPLGGDYWIVATDLFGRYAGMVSLNEAHTMTLDEVRCRQPLTALLRHTDCADPRHEHPGGGAGVRGH